MTPGGDEMLDAEQVIAEALAGSPRCCCPDDWRAEASPSCPNHGDGQWPPQHEVARAAASLAALDDAGCLVFDSPAAVWAWVRERLLTDEVAWKMAAAKGNEDECDTGMGGCGGTHTDCYYRSLLSAALTHAEQEKDR